MTIQFQPGTEQLKDLALLRDLGEENIRAIADKFRALDSVIKPSDIVKSLADVLPDRPSDVKVLMNVFMSLVTLRRERNVTNEALFEGLYNGIVSSGAWEKDELNRWEELKPQIASIFEQESIWTVAKALDLSYDYENLLQSAKILTDIRPVFSNDASAIRGAVVSFTLRLSFGSIEGNSENLSIALDREDIESLRASCDRALKKAETARSFMQKSNVKGTYIKGEEVS